MWSLFLTILSVWQARRVFATDLNNVRLPTHLKPVNYQISLTPFMIPGNFTVSGYISIVVDVLESSTNVTLHTKDILVKEVVVGQVLGYKYPIDRIELVEELDFFVIHLQEPLKIGEQHVIRMRFISKLSDGLHGFYRSQYLADDGTIRTLATTQFEPTHARKAFPCFDEPQMKAKFNIRIGRTAGMHAISNMPKIQNPIRYSSDLPGYIYDQFEESVPMSTYLVAFVISDFEFNESELRQNNVTFRIWARKNALDQTDYARGIGARILQYFEHYFDIDFPLPKQDMIAIPDFSAGAMENWGLITYRETTLLYKRGVSPRSAKQRIALVVSHELAHQWFGNLVTPKWWTDLWLNEGFASYVEYLGVEAVEPNMKVMEQFITSELQNVMRVDALTSSHPVSVKVSNPDEIAQIFDRISYGKGATIIRMMDHFLTENTFRKGVANYLRHLQYKNADQDDLWRFLTEQGHADGTLPESMNIKTIMDTWTLQTGFPVLNVKRDYSRRAANISQERFFLNKLHQNGSPFKWWIPVTYRSCNNMKNPAHPDVHWLSQDHDWKMVFDLPESDQPVVFNVRQTEQSLVPWRSATMSFRYLKSMFQRTPAYGEFQKFMKHTARPVYRQHGLRSMIHNAHEDSLLRSEIIDWACSIEVEECCNNVRELFDVYVRSGRDQDGINENEIETADEDFKEEEGGEAIAEMDFTEAHEVDMDLKKAIMCNALALGGEKEWNQVWASYLASNVAAQKQYHLRILACTKEIWILNKYLNMSVNPQSGIRKQDATLVISNVARNVHGRDLTFDFVRSHWNHLKDYLGGRFERALGSVLGGRNTQLELDELRAFVKMHEGEFGAGQRAVEQALETTEANVHWMDTHYYYITDWLSQQNQIQAFTT
ncbi:hypothetical protein TCAL_04682 [Tigriopus californicus]|uniref:Aminopeptidase n=1 Tax=Tigriopus californicus TaxID=6832 RepID=A0A553NVK0_TIGCA|nr:hypothetical protein TCAL_04682 [Tigriopus californicus]